MQVASVFNLSPLAAILGFFMFLHKQQLGASKTQFVQCIDNINSTNYAIVELIYTLTVLSLGLCKMLVVEHTVQHWKGSCYSQSNPLSHSTLSSILFILL